MNSVLSVIGVVYISNIKNIVAKNSGKRFNIVEFQTRGTTYETFVNDDLLDVIVKDSDMQFSGDLVVSNRELKFSNVMFEVI